MPGSDGFPRRCRDRTHAAHHGEAGFGPKSARIVSYGRQELAGPLSSGLLAWPRSNPGASSVARVSIKLIEAGHLVVELEGRPDGELKAILVATIRSREPIRSCHPSKYSSQSDDPHSHCLGPETPDSMLDLPGYGSFFIRKCQHGAREGGHETDERNTAGDQVDIFDPLS
jgi:hypothetical protein